VGKQGGLKGFEMAKNIHLEPAGFMARGILTNTMKIQRHLAKNTYRESIDALYNEKELK
jgi:long-chain acyl-CoA synthetase